MTPKGSYHHGDLRAALLVAGLKLLDAEGEHAVTSRAVARLTDVSHSAPAHHFGDHDGLLEALAQESARQLSDSLREASMSSADAVTSSQRIGIAYVHWAVEHPHRFRLLGRYRAGSPLVVSSETMVGDDDGARGRAWDAYARMVLVEAFIAGQEAGLIAEGDPMILAMTSWATMHGLATLLLDELMTEGPPTAAEAERLAMDVTVVLGLGLIRRV